MSLRSDKLIRPILDAYNFIAMNYKITNCLYCSHLQIYFGRKMSASREFEMDSDVEFIDETSEQCEEEAEEAEPESAEHEDVNDDLIYVRAFEKIEKKLARVKAYQTYVEDLYKVCSEARDPRPVIQCWMDASVLIHEMIAHARVTCDEYGVMNRRVGNMIMRARSMHHFIEGRLMHVEGNEAFVERTAITNSVSIGTQTDADIRPSVNEPIPERMVVLSASVQADLTVTRTFEVQWPQPSAANDASQPMANDEPMEMDAVVEPVTDEDNIIQIDNTDFFEDSEEQRASSASVSDWSDASGAVGGAEQAGPSHSTWFAEVEGDTRSSDSVRSREDSVETETHRTPAMSDESMQVPQSSAADQRVDDVPPQNDAARTGAIPKQARSGEPAERPAGNTYRIPRRERPPNAPEGTSFRIPRREGPADAGTSNQNRDFSSATWNNFKDANARVDIAEWKLSSAYRSYYMHIMNLVAKRSIPPKANIGCRYCYFNGWQCNHKLHKCSAFRALARVERIAWVEAADLCHNCLSPYHVTQRCQAPNGCSCDTRRCHCESAHKHNSLLCGGKRVPLSGSGNSWQNSGRRNDQGRNNNNNFGRYSRH